ncbi:DUF1430 domain-containing protein [Paenibacillus oceani]|uniref:DUF1430 domain-containing protein n=1 Tax=Paenibacillus oceani TaxID=2772510 RepID=A0A927C3Q4_9BACL|nr:DUF1430 domain-containing protein [Paenibacillus oceani]MBD2860758.1 DUF1430 domain-containing protein [Paenibacillus oceani]
MKTIKYIVSFCILFIGLLIIGESHTFRLNNFYTEFHNTTLYLQPNTTEEEMIRDTLRSAERHGVEIFTFVRSTPSLFQTKYDLYGTPGVKRYLDTNLDIQEKSYESLFLEDIQFRFHDFATVPGLDTIHDFYIIGSLEKATAFKIELIDKYAGNHPKKGYTDPESRNTIIAIWLLMMSIVLLLTYYDVLFQKKENLIRVSMGESIGGMMWRNVLTDTFVFTALFAAVVLFLAPFTSVYFGVRISLTLFAALIVFNALLYLNMYVYNLTEVFSNSKGGSKKLLALNYGLKLVTVIVTIFVISGNVAVLYESYQLYKQKSFFENYSDYSYVRLNHRLVVDSDGNITNRMSDTNTVEQTFYKQFFHSANATLLSDMDGLVNGNALIANRNAYDYLSRNIKELTNADLTKDIYLLVPEQIPVTEELIESFQDSLRLYEGESFAYEYEVIPYKGRVELVSIEVNLAYGSEILKNPVIIYNNKTVEQVENRPVDPERFFPFIEEIMYKVSDDEFDRFVQEHGMSREIVRKTNVLDKYNHSWNLAQRVLAINLIFSTLVLLLEFIIIVTIIKLEYEVNAIELAIKKVLGHSLPAKHRKLVLMTLVTSVLSIGAAVTAALVLELNNVSHLVFGGIVILALELAVIFFYIRKIEHARIQNTLKGGNL